jgi:hypothetical protein
MKRSSVSGMAWGFLVLMLASLACTLPGSQAQTQPGLAETSIALAVQQTSLAKDKDALATQSAATATLPPPTVTLAQPSATIQPSATLEPSATLAPATATLVPSPTAVDMEAKIKGANVLVFEDMWGYAPRSPLVKEAVSEMNFSGGRVVELGDALGKFKEQLLNVTHWDLIIVAAEARTQVQGEFWKYVYDQVNRGAAVIIEAWYLDQHYSDIQPLLGKCGLEFQKNWGRGWKYNIEDYAIYWLQPDHPFFERPQEPVTLGNVNYLYWTPPLTEDAGDLLQISGSGDAVLLGGTQPNSKSNYGVLATCLKGTMMVQTFSSHDYKPSEVVKLWRNMMRYTLTNHFEQMK